MLLFFRRDIPFSVALLATVLLCFSQLGQLRLEEDAACAKNERRLAPGHHHGDDSSQASGLLQQRKNTSVMHADDVALLEQPQDTIIAHVKDVEEPQSSWSSLQSWFKPTPPKPAKPTRPKLAVLIAGLADRLVLLPKIHVVLNPIVSSGWDVDLYLSVVGAGNGSKAVWHAIENSTSAVLAEKLHTMADVQSLATAGGWTIRFGELDADSQEVASSFPDDPVPDRLTLYPPTESEIGMNVLRRFKTTEQLMRKIQEVEEVNHFSYDFVLVTKDDDHWLGPLDMGWFLAVPEHDQAVFSKDCLEFNGINDKTLLFGRTAAERVLPRLYTDFWNPNFDLETDNIETLWLALVYTKGARSSPVSLEKMPTCDSVYVQRKHGLPYLCQKECYMCEDYENFPNDGRFSQPHFCPEP